MLRPHHNLITVFAVSDSKDDEEEEMLYEAEAYSEFYAWNELRLHPLLMKSISRLGFKEPTPIQRACIPAAAHQGKVCLESCMKFFMVKDYIYFTMMVICLWIGCYWCC